uniref:Uncharacterized protein n=1 Tax=Hyaloperonospora arabidopsidis (strain Emoy2) TaxID=559515 RepID=M4BTQ8_HYAAE
MHVRYSRPHHSNPSYQPQHTSTTSKYSSAYENYSSPVKPTTSTSYQHRSYVEYYPSPSSPTTYYNQQQHHQYQSQQTKYYPSGASTASSSSQEGPFYADELDELDDYNMGMASADMTTIPTVPTPMKLSKYELGKTPSGRVMVTAGNQTVEFFTSVANAPLSRCMMVHE